MPIGSMTNSHAACGRWSNCRRRTDPGPWFPGGSSNDYITLYITTGFGRLRHLGVDIDVAPCRRLARALDTWIDEQYREIVAHGNKDKNNLSSTIALSCTVAASSWTISRLHPNAREATDYFLVRLVSIGPSWDAGSHRLIWRSR